MAFFGRIGNLLRQTASRQVSSELRSSPSFFQAIRCMTSAPSTKLFIGGVSYSTDEQSLREAFSKYGDVVDARIIMDRETGRSRGFGFITFTSVEEASSAIQALDGQDLHGRLIKVNYANERPRGYGGGGFGGSYGGGGGGYQGGYGGGGGYQGGYGGGGGGYQGGYGGGGGNYGDSGNTYAGGSSGGYGGNSGNFGDTAGYDGSAVDGGVATGTGTNFADGYNGSGGAEFGSSGQLDSKANSNGDENFGDFRDDNDADNFAKRA